MTIFLSFRQALYGALLLSALSASGQSIFDNSISGAVPAVNPYTSGQIVAAHLSVSGIGHGSGVTGVADNDQYTCNGWPLTFDANSYFTFTLNPSPGYRINFINLIYTAVASITGGPTVFSVRSSLDGFTSNLGIGILAGGGSINLSGAAFQNITSSVEFRIYAWVAALPSGTYSIKDFTFNAAVVLPIELTAFKAEATDARTATLQFSTATEQGNDYFSIERSSDGTRFEAIGQVRGAGDSNVPQDYVFKDEQPLKGLNFYRLRQVDFDGQYTYSPVASVSFEQSSGVHLAPQPVGDQLQVRLETAADQESQWQVFDFAGRLLQSGRLEAETPGFDIPTATFTKGTYVLRLISGQSVRTRLFQKG